MPIDCIQGRMVEKPAVGLLPTAAERLISHSLLLGRSVPSSQHKNRQAAIFVKIVSRLRRLQSYNVFAAAR